jgi:hypothetical protein
MRKMLVVLAAVALAASPAYSQGKGRKGKRSGSEQPSAEQRKKKNDASERDYKAAIDRLPDKPYDPWHKMR